MVQNSYRSYFMVDGARCAGSDELTPNRGRAPQPALRACVASRHAVGRRACHRSQCTDGPTTRECQSQRIANTYTDVRSPPQSARRVTPRGRRRSRARSRCRAHLSRSRRHALNDGRCGRGWALGGSGERRAACARRSLWSATIHGVRSIIGSSSAGGRCVSAFGECQERATGASRSHVLDC